MKINDKKLIILLIIVIALFSCSTVSAATTYNVNNNMTNDFIQIYMGFLTTGDTLNFTEGKYTGIHLEVNKEINIRSDLGKVKFTGNDYRPGLKINSNNVNISNINFTNYETGILVNKSNNVKITNTSFANTNTGIDIKDSTNSNIVNTKNVKSDDDPYSYIWKLVNIEDSNNSYVSNTSIFDFSSIGTVVSIYNSSNSYVTNLLQFLMKIIILILML